MLWMQSFIFYRLDGLRQYISTNSIVKLIVLFPLLLCVFQIDNLVKGASGQALQNLNLMMGLPETEGLMQQPMFP